MARNPEAPDVMEVKGATRGPDAPHPLLRNRSFVRLWLAGTASSFGFQMVAVAVGWQVYAITGRVFDLGLIGLVQFIPSLLLALPAGHAADRYDRRRIVFVSQIVVGCAIGLLALLTALDRLDERGIFAILFVIGTATSFRFPSQQALLPGIVPAAVLPRAMALSSSGSQAAAIVGPAIGGLLFIAGARVVYATATVLYLVAVLLLAGLRVDRVLPPREPVTWRSVLGGFHFIAHHRDVLGVISLDLFAVLLGGTTALLPLFAKDVLHTGPVGLGVLRSAPAAGAMLMALWLARRSLERRVGMTMFGAVAGFGVATIVFGLSTQLWLSLAALFALGACDMVSVVIRSALVQLDTPDAMRGRVGGVNAIFVNTSNQLGDFESGMVAAWVGAVPAVLIGGVGTLVVVGLWMRMFPALRRRQALHGERDG